MIGALQTLGLDVDGDGTDLTVSGELAPGTRARIDCGLAGTVLRFVPPLAALSTAAVEFDGDDQARARPIAPLLDALRGLGVDIEGTGLPFLVRGHGSVRGGTVYIDASASSQFVSGLLLSGAAFTRRPDVGAHRYVGPVGPAYRDDGGDAAPGRGRGRRHGRRPVAGSSPDRSRHDAGTSSPTCRTRCRSWPRPPSPVGRCASPAGRVCSVQPAETILDILKLVGSTVRLTDSYLEARGAAGGYPGFDVDLHDVGELAPSVAALAALATPGSVSRLTGIAHLRGHETDRLAALSAEINALGGDCTETDDGLVITATPLHGGTWHSYADHRMAMAGAIVGLRVPGVAVEDIATTAKTLPEFPQLWAEMLGRD